jgi:mono/diheme cytochrome c family protein
MLRQPRADAYGETAAFADGMVMRVPPHGSVPAGPAEPAWKRGEEYLAEAPVPINRAALAHGRTLFETNCAPCHGIEGDGVSVVATKMELRKPPSLQDDEIHAYPVGRLYEIVRFGYGLMPPYAPELATYDDRWALVAYVKALQWSRRANVAELPQDLQGALARLP